MVPELPQSMGAAGWLGPSAPQPVTVPESGFYIIVPRSKQDVYAGMYTSRKVYINGEVPFAEAANLRFDYSSDWQTNPLASADGETQ